MRKIVKTAIVLSVLILAAFAFQTLKYNDVLTVACLTDREAEVINEMVVAPYVNIYPSRRIRVISMFKNDDTPFDINESLPKRVASILKWKADIYLDLPAESVRELVSHGAVENLDPYLEHKNDIILNMAKPVSTILQAEGGGHFYALAPTFGSMALAYNKDMFDAADVDYPEGSLTWEEAFALGAKVASKTSKSTAAFSFGPEGVSNFHSTFLQLAPSAGVYVIDGDKVEVDENFIELWDFFMDAQRRYCLSKDGGAFWRGESALSLVYNGQVDDPLTFQSDPTFLRFNWDLSPIPVFDKGQPISYANIQSAIVMSATSNKKDEAWNFISYLVSAEYGSTIASKIELPWSGSLPSMTSSKVLASLRSREDKNYEAFYSNAAPKTRAISHNERGYTYVDFLLQRLMVDTLNERIDGRKAAAIVSSRGQKLYSSTEVVDPSNPEAFRKLIGY